MDLKLDSIYQDEVNSQVHRQSIISGVDKKQQPLSQSQGSDFPLHMYDFHQREYVDAPPTKNKRYQQNSVNSSSEDKHNSILKVHQLSHRSPPPISSSLTNHKDYADNIIIN